MPHSHITRHARYSNGHWLRSTDEPETAPLHTRQQIQDTLVYLNKHRPLPYGEAWIQFTCHYSATDCRYINGSRQQLPHISSFTGNVIEPKVANNG